jgi:addiction module HigA family antidote
MPRKLKPIHPGVHLLEDFMKPLGLSSHALARALHVTAARINEILRGRRGITADTALRLARYFGTDPQSWLNLQTHYDLQVAKDAAGARINRIRPAAA